MISERRGDQRECCCSRRIAAADDGAAAAVGRRRTAAAAAAEAEAGTAALREPATADPEAVRPIPLRRVNRRLLPYW